MAVPKRRVSRTKRDSRRSSVWKLEAPAIAKCGSCGTLKLAHRLCPECGMYKGRLVVKKEED